MAANTLKLRAVVRIVMHAGEVRYDPNGCFGEALDVAFRLLDASRVKKALRDSADSSILVISGEIYNSVVRHGYDGIDDLAFRPLVRVQIAGNRYPGWIHTPSQAGQHQVSEMASYRTTRLKGSRLTALNNLRGNPLTGVT